MNAKTKTDSKPAVMIGVCIDCGGMPVIHEVTGGVDFAEAIASASPHRIPSDVSAAVGFLETNGRYREPGSIYSFDDLSGTDGVEPSGPCPEDPGDADADPAERGDGYLVKASKPGLDFRLGHGSTVREAIVWSVRDISSELHYGSIGPAAKCLSGGAPFELKCGTVLEVVEMRPRRIVIVEHNELGLDCVRTIAGQSLPQIVEELEFRGDHRSCLAELERGETYLKTDGACSTEVFEIGAEDLGFVETLRSSSLSEPVHRNVVAA
ncbi:MAG: hypothetical protein ACE37M_07900 [Henriciella sp.]